MRLIIGYGNPLRGEDGFGVDVIKELEECCPEATRLLQVHTLTPELVLEMQEVDEVVFVDAAYSDDDLYAIASPLLRFDSMLSHHIQPDTLMEMLEKLYEKKPEYWVYSMLTNSFETINDKTKYEEAIKTLISHLR